MTAPKLGDELEKPESVTDNSNSADKPNLKGDWLNFFLLLLLYTMQGIPLGIAAAMPIILQSNKNVSYKDQVNIWLDIKNIKLAINCIIVWYKRIIRLHPNIRSLMFRHKHFCCVLFQALFSLVAWPFSLKLIWAPLVDALYVQKTGRRKSWLIPVQYLMGVYKYKICLRYARLFAREYLIGLRHHLFYISWILCVLLINAFYEVVFFFLYIFRWFIVHNVIEWTAMSVFKTVCVEQEHASFIWPIISMNGCQKRESRTYWNWYPYFSSLKCWPPRRT